MGMKSHFSLPLLALSKKEKLVLSALKEGFSTPLLIYEKTKVSRTAIYHILSILKERGLVKKYKQDGKFYFRIATEKELSDTLYETKKELLGFVSGKEEIEISDSMVVVHRGIEAVKACLLDVFTHYKNQRFLGIQGNNDTKLWADEMSVPFINKINSLIKKNKIISEGVGAEGLIENFYTTFGKDWVEDYMGRMGRIHYIDPKYFSHSADIYIFKDATYLISIHDKLIIEIRHSDITIAITKLIHFIMDTTRPIDYAERIRKLIEKDGLKLR